jgi:fructosamine-3-kinase
MPADVSSGSAAIAAAWHGRADRCRDAAPDGREIGARTVPPRHDGRLEPELAAAIEHALGTRVTSTRAVHGGDVAIAYAVELADGGRVFAKTHPAAPPQFFTTEAAGLRWLREGLTADGPLAVPDVLAVSDDAPNHLVLEWIDEAGGARSRAGAERAFGVGLARLHAAGARVFGREDRRTTGSRGLPNDPADTWAEFYAERRLVPLARLARDARALPPEAIDRLERVAGRLGELGGAAEPPSRLHGDLWAGNRLLGADGRHWLVDPAAHGGHREFDLAMMRLFGGFGVDAFAAYEDVTPLAAGWRARVALHQIVPLVVHAIKFGGGYVGAATAAIDRYA